MENYWGGRSYAWRVNRFLYRDILHDAYLHWHSKTGKNLFDEPIKRVIRVIKLTYYGYYISQNIRNREWFEFEDNIFNNVNPEQQYIESESFETLITQIKSRYPKTSEQIIESLNLKLQGYQQKEIAEKLGVNKSLITYYFNNIRSMDMNAHNRFNGNKAKPIKTITIKTYNERYKDEYILDFDREWCDENETSMLVVHKDREEYITVLKKNKD